MNGFRLALGKSIAFGETGCLPVDSLCAASPEANFGL